MFGDQLGEKSGGKPKTKNQEKYRKQIIEFIAKNSKSNHPLTNKTLFNWFYLIKENKPNHSTANNNKLSLTMAVNNDEIVSILGFYNVQFRIENKIKNGIPILLPEEARKI